MFLFSVFAAYDKLATYSDRRSKLKKLLKEYIKCDNKIIFIKFRMKIFSP